MKIVDSAYQIIVILAISDRVIHQNEIVSIQLFLENHLDKISKERAFTLQDEILKLTQEQKLQMLFYNAEYFKEQSNLRNRLRMVSYSLDLILSDHKVTDEEKLRFKMLGEYWGINLDRFIKRKIKKKSSKTIFDIIDEFDF